MPKVTFITHEGSAREVEAKTGVSVMETAVKNGVPGIDGDCGGAAACATCHIYVDPAWSEAVGSRTDLEESMLEFAEGTRPNSRLACQIRMHDDLDGLIVHLPEHQH
ncbi:MAG: (2Fe-2S)-binding protein [Phenylobacterium sp.]|nr:(2Fe-2S)-binding protein [Phenylobacterium sp.]